MKGKDFKKTTSRTSLPKEVKNYVFQRDNFQCQSCGKSKPETALEVDHIIPLVNGGSNDISNLQCLCCRCNRQKKHHFDQRFRRRFS